MWRSRCRRSGYLLPPQRCSIAVVAALAAIVLGACGAPGGSPWWRGSWSVQASPSPLASGVTGYAGTQADALYAVSCPSPTYCVAVGSWAKTSANFNHPLLLVYSAGRWATLHASELPGSLYGVSCPSASTCVALGSDTYAIVRGSSVSIQPLPTIVEGRLGAVSCPSTTDCWAVGYGPYAYTSFSRTDPDHLVIAHLLGSRWSSVDPPAIPRPRHSALRSLLFGVSCPDSTSCIAVGETGSSPTGVQEMLVLSYDGSSWSYVPMPALQAHHESWLRGVSCLSARSCVAVGATTIPRQRSTNGFVDRTLVANYDGSSWSMVRSPDPLGGLGSDDLVGAACVSAGRCVATGFTTDSAGDTSNLALASSRGTWSPVGVPDAGGNSSLGDRHFVGCSSASCWDNSLAGLACPTASTCFAVGSITYESDENDQSTTSVARTLVLRYAGS